MAKKFQYLNFKIGLDRKTVEKNKPKVEFSASAFSLKRPEYLETKKILLITSLYNMVFIKSYCFLMLPIFILINHKLTKLFKETCKLLIFSNPVDIILLCNDSLSFHEYGNVSLFYSNFLKLSRTLSNS